VFVVQTEYTLFAITSFLPSIKAAISLSSHIMSLFVRLGNWKSTTILTSLSPKFENAKLLQCREKKKGKGESVLSSWVLVLGSTDRNCSEGFRHTTEVVQYLKIIQEE
jgi:hypothetical protein